MPKVQKVRHYLIIYLFILSFLFVCLFTCLYLSPLWQWVAALGKMIDYYDNTLFSWNIYFRRTHLDSEHVSRDCNLYLSLSKYLSICRSFSHSIPCICSSHIFSHPHPHYRYPYYRFQLLPLFCLFIRFFRFLSNCILYLAFLGCHY